MISLLFKAVQRPSASMGLLLLLAGLSAGNTSAQSPEFLSAEVRGKGPAVLLIPGLGCSGEVWNSTVDALAADHECHVVTLAGFGGQPPVPGPFLDTAEAALKQYVLAHHLERPVIIGHSLGGLLALRLSAHLLPAPRATIVVDALPFYSGMQPGATPESAKQFAEFLRGQMEKQTREQFLANTSQSAGMLVTADRERVRVCDWMKRSDQQAVAQAMSDVIAYDGRPLLAEINCPVLVVEAGVVPGAVPEELYRTQYSTLRGVKQVRISDARHFVMLDQPARFVQEIGSFLQAVAP